MNLKIAKQRGSRGEVSNASLENTIQLANFYSKTNPMLQARGHSQKQNIHPNVRNIQKQKLKQKQNTPKKKVIHLKSAHRNSRSNKAGNSGSCERRYSNDHYCTQVTDFNDKFADNARPIKIQIDLKNHRRSMQDTLVSSYAQEISHLQSAINCVDHDQKKATFIIRGKPYCDKCSVKFITKGFVAMKIKNGLTHQLIENNVSETEFVEKQKQKRNRDLRLFIDQLDKLQPSLESINHQLEYSLGNIKLYFQNQSQQFEQSWNNFTTMLQQHKEILVSKMKAQQDSTINTIMEIKSRISKEASNLIFMRNDIVRNIDRITDEAVIPTEKYASVMQSFSSQMQQMRQSIISTSQASVPVQVTQLHMQKLSQAINSCIQINFSQWPLLKPGHNDLPIKMDDQNPYRLSFGRDTTKLASPTFKQI